MIYPTKKTHFFFRICRFLTTITNDLWRQKIFKFRWFLVEIPNDFPRKFFGFSFGFHRFLAEITIDFCKKQNTLFSEFLDFFQESPMIPGGKKNRFFFLFLCHINHWWFLQKIEKFWKILKKSVFYSCRNHWWFVQEIDEIRTKIQKYAWRNHWGFLPGNSEIRKSMIQEKLPGEINGVSSQVSSQHFPYDFDTRTNQWRFFNQIQPI